MVVPAGGGANELWPQLHSSGRYSPQAPEPVTRPSRPSHPPYVPALPPSHVTAGRDAQLVLAVGCGRPGPRCGPARPGAGPAAPGAVAPGGPADATPSAAEVWRPYQGRGAATHGSTNFGESHNTHSVSFFCNLVFVRWQFLIKSLSGIMSSVAAFPHQGVAEVEGGSSQPAFSLFPASPPPIDQLYFLSSPPKRLQ